MAFRNLFGVALVALGALALGCGAGEGRTAIDPPDDGLPPRSEDQPPHNEDRPTSNDDQPAPNSDQPSRNPDQPGGPGVDAGGGGLLEDLCEAVCTTVEECSDTEAGVALGRFCSTGCRASEGGTASLPCESQFVALLGCAFDAAGGECPTEANQAALAQQCNSAVQAYTSCLEAEDDDDDTPEPGQGNCTSAGGCEDCGSQCMTCVCEADGDVDDAVSCLMLDDCPAVMP